MKYHLVSIVTLAVLFGSCLNKTDKEATTQPQVATAGIQPRDSANFTRIEWLDSAKHLGTINQGQVLKIDYHFRNSGNKPLVLENVRPSCGCTVANFPKKPIAPGEEAVINAEFDSHGKEGQQHKSITVTANTAEATELHFDVNIVKS